MRVFLIVVAILFAPAWIAAQVSPEDQVRDLLGQIAALQSRIQSLQAGEAAVPTTCPRLARSLYRGISGDDVRALQQFLTSEGVFQADATGYFGAVTEEAVRAWQVREHIINPGGDTSGWGIVGPRTRAHIDTTCATTRARVPGATHISVTPLEHSGSTTTNDVGPAASSTCIACRPHKPPVVSRINGPATLEVGVEGVFTIIASDPDEGPLTYAIEWGAGGEPIDALYALAGVEAESPSNVFRHTYAAAGLFTIQATVRDSDGSEATMTAQVRVTPQDTTCPGCTAPQIYAPPIDLGDDAIQVPSGITSCATPWGGIILHDGGTISANPYFRGSVSWGTEVPVMKCTAGYWQKCNALGQSCTPHKPIRPNATMQSLRRYSDVVGSAGCGGYGAGVTVLAEPRTLLCANVIHQALQGRCAYTQEDTAVELFCSYNNWGERLTLQ